MRRRLSTCATCKRHNVNAVRRLSRSSAGRKAQANLLCFGRGRGGSGVRDSGVVSLQVGLDSFGCSALGSCRRLRDGGRLSHHLRGADKLGVGGRGGGSSSGVGGSGHGVVSRGAVMSKLLRR